MKSVKHVFVTGASSELIRQVLTKFDSTEYRISGLTRSGSGSGYGSIKMVKGDINEPETYRMEVETADIIIHAAAITHSKRPEPYFTVNIEGTKTLISTIPEKKSLKFIFISSRVAGENSGAYGVSKLRAEEEVKKLKNWLIIRPSEVYGGNKTEGIEKTLDTAISGGVQLCPIGIGSKMYPIHQADVASAIYKSAVDDHQSRKTIIMNGSKGYSFRELHDLVQRISGKKITMVPIPRWLLGFVAKVSIYVPFDIGFVPDQVARLYSKKSHGSGGEETVDFEEYVQQLMNRNTP